MSYANAEQMGLWSYRNLRTFAPSKRHNNRLTDKNYERNEKTNA